jgi:hypothetical protein
MIRVSFRVRAGARAMVWDRVRTRIGISISIKGRPMIRVKFRA